MSEVVPLAQIKKYFSQHKPLGKNVHLKNVRFLGGGNHFNYHLKTNDGDFVIRINRLDALGVYTMLDVPDEFTILKLIERYKVAPRVLCVDLEKFSQPLLIEEYIEGKPYNTFKKLDKEKFGAVISLMSKISKIKLSSSRFLFRFLYTTYETDINNWKGRIGEIKKLGGGSRKMLTVVKNFNEVVKDASKILLENQSFLSKSKPVFIYNDVHGENLLWVPKSKKAIFIDWQKVSLGDISFMPAVFALAFENKFGKSREKFFAQVIDEYNKVSKVKNFDKLFRLRILEREVANMIWVVWASLKQGKNLPFRRITEYERYNRTKNLVSRFYRLSVQNRFE